MANTDARPRQELLRKLLVEGKISTQEELAEELRRHKFDITQSTISRDLRRIGAIKTTNHAGATVYKISMENAGAVPIPRASLKHLLLNVQHNGSMIVINTAVGSASLVAAHLDRIQLGGILGTMAGDDTIFVAPASTQQIDEITERILASV